MTASGRYQMRSIPDTIARLTAAAARDRIGDASGPSPLKPLEEFGSNPGALKAYVHIPAYLSPHAPLVVVLHGCTQSASGYDRASGWSKLADELGFALLYPEQLRSNNLNRCFNWFEAADARRDSGEALSIRQMIAQVQKLHAIDFQRTFVTGLSAGGAMASTMLATYPEVFAGGAIIAGLPHGVANGMVQAFDRMRGHGLPAPAQLQSLLRQASDHAGPWPRVSIWHGSADGTVSVANAEAIAAQWRAVHGLSERPTDTNVVDEVPHRTWCGFDGRALVEEYIVPGMGHGTPLRTKGPRAYGSSAPFMLDVGISSTLRIAQFWGLVASAKPAAKGPRPFVSEGLSLPATVESRRLHGRRIEPETPAAAVSGVGKVIEDALRAAGLMK